MCLLLTGDFLLIEVPVVEELLQVLLDSERGDKSMEEASFPEMKMMIRKLQNGLIKN